MKLQPGADEQELNNGQTQDEQGQQKAQGGAPEGSGDDGQEPSDADIPESLKAYVQKLRKENAKYRTKAKNLEGESATVKEREAKVKKAMAILAGADENDELNPEELVPQLQQRVQGIEIEHAILQSAYMNGIPQDQLGYYRYQISERLGALEDGEELTDEDFAEIVAECQRVGGARASGGQNTGVGTGKAPNPAPGGSGSLTVEQFKKMSVTEKSQLYAKDPATYQRLRDSSR